MFSPNLLGMSDVRMKCTNGADYLSPGGGCSSDWSVPVFCNKGEVFCGYQIRYDDDSPFADNIAGSDLLFMCCLICKKYDGFYLAISGLTSSCAFCYAYCRTCSDAGISKCLTCFKWDTLVGTQCSIDIGYDEVIKAFSADTFSDSDSDISKFSSDLAAIKTTTCYGKSWVGGYNIFGMNNRLTYLLQNQAPHFKVRIKAKLLKIDEWADNSFRMLFDGIMTKVANIANNPEKFGKLFFGNQCGGEGPEDIINMDHIMNHKTNADLNITFKSDLVKSASETSWGVRDIIIGTYKCHVSCMTCTGPKNTDCTECYPQASMVGGLCTCNDNYFEVVVASPCMTYPCTVCQPCFPGCNKCTSNAANACLSCSTGYFKNVLVQNNCVDICPDGYYGDTSTKQCELCDIDCVTCSGGKNICTSCAYMKNGNSCIPPYCKSI